MNETILDMQITLGKMAALTDAIKASGFLDLNELDQEQEHLLLYQHDNTAQLFSVLEDYLEQAITLNNKLCDAVNNEDTITVGELKAIARREQTE